MTLQDAAFQASPQVNLVGLNEITTIDRWELERRSRALVQPVYLGDSVALCRMLGRYKFFVDTTDLGFGAHLLLDGFWESWLTVFIARRVAPGAAVADVGANHGYYTLLMADVAGPEGRVAAVEPNPKACGLLRRSVDLNGFADRVTVLEQAAGSEDDCEVLLYLPPHEPKNARVVAQGAHEDVVPVRSGRLATALGSWDRLDFIKIDTEGAEEAVIAGLRPLLAKHRPDVILEFNAGRCGAPAALLDDLLELYGALTWLDFDGELRPADREALLDPTRTEDWLLFASAR